jgi:hypothetical protein
MEAGNIPANSIRSKNSTDAEQSSVKEFFFGEGVELLTLVHILLILLVAIHLIYFVYMLFKQNVCKSGPPKQPEKPNNLRKINETCSICLEDIMDEVQLLCSHSYCAKCIVDYGKQRWNFYDIQCPMCRVESKLMFSLFERNEENKEYYDQILSYNHEVTSHYATSFCFCLDMLRFMQYYIKQLTNFQNPRFANHRKVIILAILFVMVVVLYPLTLKLPNIYELCEDIFFYIALIVFCSEYFYRIFRRQTNSEFESLISSNLSRDVDVNISNANSINNNINVDNVVSHETGNNNNNENNIESVNRV